MYMAGVERLRHKLIGSEDILYGIKFQFSSHPEFLYSFPSGFLLFKDFCLNEINEAVPQVKFYEEVRSNLS